MAATPDLLYRWDAEPGRMRLEPRGIPLDEPLRKQIEHEIRGLYPRLLERLDRKERAVIVRLEGLGQTSRVPARFLVRFADAEHARNPSLSLTPVEEIGAMHSACEPPRADDVPLDDQIRAELLQQESEAVERTLALNRTLARHRALRPWIAGLLEDLEFRFAAGNLDELSKWDRAALGVAVGEFRTLCRERPDDLAIVALAGYVALCESNSQGGDSEEAALYALAAQGLERLFAPSLDADESMVEAPRVGRPNPRDGTLRRISRMLARLLGLEED